MEGRLDDVPVKVCRRCSVASRTQAGTCPNCGKPYRRRLWRWWMAIPIVAVAFAGGYFGRQALQDDEPAEPPLGLTLGEAKALAVGSAPPKLEQVLDGQKPAKVRRQSAGGNQLLCRYYVVVDQEYTLWEACFLDGRLEVSRALDVKR